jgi:hypothetical protein
VGQVVLVALRDSRAKISFDLRDQLTLSSHDEFRSAAAAPNLPSPRLRRRLETPRAQARYAGHRAHVQRRIDAEKRRLEEASRKRARAGERRVAVASRRG